MSDERNPYDLISKPRPPAGGLRFDRSGDGPPLVLIHPIGSDRGYWQPLVNALSKRHDVIVPDLPGFGESAPLPRGESPTPGRLARSIAELLDELGLSRAHAAGSSLGAWVALELAAIGRAHTVTAICPSGVGPSEPLPGRPPRATSPMLPLVLRSRRFRRLVLGKVMAFPEQAPLDWTVRFSRAWATAPAFDATRRAMEATLFSAWDRVQVPVTLAWGEHDTQIEPIPAPRSEIRSVTLPGCGHVPIWDNPDALIRTVLETTHDRRGREEATIAAD